MIKVNSCGKRNATISEELPDDICKLSHSQIGQELWVVSVYGAQHKGYFVDVGGYDGIQDSNTFILETDLGWDGVIVEPDPKSFVLLERNRGVSLSDLALSDRSEGGRRFLSGGELGGLLEFLQDDVHATERQRLIQKGLVVSVSTGTLTDLLEGVGSPGVIEYLDLDTEGSELAILHGLDLSRFRFGLMTVEHAGVQDKREEIARFLGNAGYERIEAWFEDWYFSPETVGELLGCSSEAAREKVVRAASKVPVIRVQNLIAGGKASLEEGEYVMAIESLDEACRDDYPNNAYAFTLAAEALFCLSDKEALERLRMRATTRYGSGSEVVLKIDGLLARARNETE